MRDKVSIEVGKTYKFLVTGGYVGDVDGISAGLWCNYLDEYINKDVLCIAHVTEIIRYRRIICIDVNVIEYICV